MLGHRELHTLWTKAVGTSGYDKQEWHALERVITRAHSCRSRGETPAIAFGEESRTPLTV